MLLSIVAPMYNEELSIGEYIKQTISVLQQNFTSYELILVDDGSKDNSVAVAKQFAEKDSHIRIVQLSRNFGQEIATTAGLNHAKGDYVILMDSDLQNPPSMIPLFYQKIQEGYDVVYAERKERIGESFLKKFTSRLFYWVACKMTGFQLPRNAADFRIMTRTVVNALNSLRENNRYQVMLYAYVGFKSTSIPYDVPPRFAGETKYNYTRMFKTALDAILSFSSRPLRIISLVSVFISVISFAYAVFIFIQYMFVDNFVEGIASVLAFVAIMFALLFLFLALLSEYIGRIMIESKRRPLYFVRDEIHYTKTESEINKEKTGDH
jgi:dolichol-phosphate mannosyltransferase